MKNIVVRTLLLTFAVTVLIALPTHANAETDIGFKGVGVRIGYVDPSKDSDLKSLEDSGIDSDLDATYLVGMFAHLGSLAPKLYWMQG